LSYVLLLGAGGALVTAGVWAIEKVGNSARKKQKNRD